MQIDFGGICARCFSCGGKDFEPLRPRPGESVDKLACTTCSAEFSFDDLRSNIGRAAIARRQAAAFPAPVQGLLEYD